MTPIRSRFTLPYRFLVYCGVAALAIPVVAQGQDRITIVSEPRADALPSITPGGIVSATAFGAFTAIAPGSWIEIYGNNLGAGTRSWAGSDFTGIYAPTSLNGTRVTIGGVPAFIDYVSATQVNAQVPSNVATGQQAVVVTTAAGSSPPVSVQVNALQPGLLAPPAFNVGGKRYVGALCPDSGTFALPPGAIPGVTSRQAHPGEVITIYGVGFGPVIPNTPAGQTVQQMNSLQFPFQVQFGTTPATVTYNGLAPGAVGLYQFNVVVPAILSSDAVPLTFTVGAPPSGVTGSQTLYIAVQNNSMPQVQNVTLSANSVVGGGSVTGTVNLSAAAVAGGASVLLTSDSSTATTPASVTVPAGAKSATFSIATRTVSATQPVTITATYLSSSAQAVLSVLPAMPRPAITSLNTILAAAGSTFDLRIAGSNLADVTAVRFSPSTGYTVNSVTPTASQIVANVSIASSVSAGSQVGVTVVSPGGTSGSLNLYVVQPIPVGSGAYDGIWSGATNQGLPFAMIVGNNAIGAFAYSVAYSGGGYSCPSGSTSISLNMSTAVTGSSFSRSDFSGSFQSPMEASGKLQWSLSIPGCSGSGTLTWTATKQ